MRGRVRKRSSERSEKRGWKEKSECVWELETKEDAINTFIDETTEMFHSLPQSYQVLHAIILQDLRAFLGFTEPSSVSCTPSFYSSSLIKPWNVTIWRRGWKVSSWILELKARGYFSFSWCFHSSLYLQKEWVVRSMLQKCLFLSSLYVVVPTRADPVHGPERNWVLDE